MKQLFIIPMLAAFLSAGVSAQEPKEVTAAELSEWCHYLAGDGMKGRRNGSPEMKLAAEYIAASFEKSGLRPFSATTGYFQEYTIRGRNNTELAERNVIGILEGSDPVLKKEWIILSAHFDHIGIGKPIDGDSIYNGADDNATGTITIMGIARNLASLGAQTGRSVMFVAYSGEEMGLRGSRWFVEHPPVPLDQIRLNLNFEMEGECAVLGKNRYILTGHQFTDFDDLLDRYNKDTGWELARKYKSPDWIFMGSDNASLAIRREGERQLLAIPAFTIVTTDDMNFIHKVTDEPGRMDYDNMASLVSYSTRLLQFLSTDPLQIRWDQEAFERAMNR